MPDVKLAILFGSQATGQARPSSDTDVAVLAGQVLTLAEKSDLAGRLVALAGKSLEAISRHGQVPARARAVINENRSCLKKLF